MTPADSVPSDPATGLKFAALNRADLQCNILTPHRRRHSAHLFLQLPADPDAADYVQSWADRVTPESEIFVEQTARVETLQLWYVAYEKWSTNVLTKIWNTMTPVSWATNPPARPTIERGLIRSFMLTSLPLHRMHPRWQAKGQQIYIQDTDFNGGATTKEPGGTAQWEAAYTNPALDACITLAADNRGVLDAAVKEEVDRLVAKGARLLGIRHGYVAKNAVNQAIEHFNYADGISNPIPETTMPPSTQPLRYDEGYPIDNFLFETTTGVIGSFMVLRQFEQDVAAFVPTPEPDQLVGRLRDGTPLGESPGTQPNNNFNFDNDPPAGSTQPPKCPFHAHVRKANPRRPEDREVIFPRRGMLYGPRKQDPTTGNFTGTPKQGVGLLFMAYMGSIDRQFRVMLREWFGGADFPEKNSGLDGIAGPGSKVTRVKGTVFLFVPPISWLNNL